MKTVKQIPEYNQEATSCIRHGWLPSLWHCSTSLQDVVETARAIPSHKREMIHLPEE